MAAKPPDFSAEITLHEPLAYTDCEPLSGQEADMVFGDVTNVMYDLYERGYDDRAPRERVKFAVAPDGNLCAFGWEGIVYKLIDDQWYVLDLKSS